MTSSEALGSARVRRRIPSSTIPAPARTGHLACDSIAPPSEDRSRRRCCHALLSRCCQTHNATITSHDSKGWLTEFKNEVGESGTLFELPGRTLYLPAH